MMNPSIWSILRRWAICRRPQFFTRLLLIFFFPALSIAEEVQRVNVCRYQSAYLLPVFVAEKKGFFREAGLEVVTSDVLNGKVCQDEIVAGRTDLTIAADAPFVYAAVQHPPLRILSQTSHSKGKGQFIVTRRDTGIKSVGDLKGKRIGYLPATSGTICLYSLLEAQQWTRSDVKLVTLQLPAMVQAIQGKQIDAFVAWEPWVSNALKNLGEQGVRLSPYFEGRAFLLGNAVVSEHGREKTAKMLRALRMANEFIEKNAEDALLISEEFLRVDRPVAAYLRDEYVYETAAPEDLSAHLGKYFSLIKKFEPEFQRAERPDFEKFFEFV